MKMTQEMSLEQKIEQRLSALEHLTERMDRLESEFDCLFRLMRLTTVAAGLTEQCKQIFADWDRITSVREAVARSSFPDEDTSPGIKRR
jgi:hypothetical protein